MPPAGGEWRARTTRRCVTKALPTAAQSVSTQERVRCASELIHQVQLYLHEDLSSILLLTPSVAQTIVPVEEATADRSVAHYWEASALRSSGTRRLETTLTASQGRSMSSFWQRSKKGAQVHSSRTDLPGTLEDRRK